MDRAGWTAGRHAQGGRQQAAQAGHGSPVRQLGAPLHLAARLLPRPCLHGSGHGCLVTCPAGTRLFIRNAFTQYLSRFYPPSFNKLQIFGSLAFFVSPELYSRSCPLDFQFTPSVQ